MKKLTILLSFMAMVCLVNAQQGGTVPANAKVHKITPVLKVDQPVPNANATPAPETKTSPPQKSAATCNHDGKACTKDGKAGCQKSAPGGCPQKGQ